MGGGPAPYAGETSGSAQLMLVIGLELTTALHAAMLVARLRSQQIVSSRSYRHSRRSSISSTMGEWMPYSREDRLVVGLASSALFDLAESNAVLG